MPIVLRADPYPRNAALNTLWAVAFGETQPRDFSRVLTRSLAHVGAYEGLRLVGFVNVAGDGGLHAFILDTCVHPDWRRQGIGTLLVQEGARLACERGAQWLHVDFEPHLSDFYRRCGFRPTEAGLLELRAPS